MTTNLERAAQAAYEMCAARESNQRGRVVMNSIIAAEPITTASWEQLSPEVKEHWKNIVFAAAAHYPREDFNLVRDVRDFHIKFDLEYIGPPRDLPVELSQFRIEFMVEELAEYKEAVSEGNREKQLDALVDLVVVALGTAHLQGFDFNEAFRRVHTANMLKRRAQKAEDSKRGSVYDVVKPEGWQPPDLSDLVKSD